MGTTARAMIHRNIDENSGVELLERGWFAALSAARAAQSERDVLLGVIELAEDAWRRASTNLAELEKLRDALGDQLAAFDGPCRDVREAVHLEQAAAARILGGSLCDALIAHCALKANAQTIYTWNIKPFNRLGESVAARVRQP
jgi:predicted nucleic acid-binding protein